MKLVYKFSPNYRDDLSTKEIMFHLLIALLVVFIATDIYYFVEYGAAFGIRAIGLLVSSVVAATLTEVVWCLVLKKDIKTFLSSSFPWITAIILTLTVQVSASYYSVIISTIIAIFFGKLVFGGFGQNIFNPAGVGRAVFASSFAGSVVNDFVTGATPTATFANEGWFAASDAAFNTFVSKFGGLTGLFIGTHPGAIGETSFLVILIVGIYLAYKKVLDYRIPVVYMGTIFVTTLIIGLVNGQGIWYPIFHLLTGGAMFGAVFMLTDPVTNPTSIPGRIVFAMGAAFFTVLIRINANLPEGVLFSILLMNILTPAIEKMFDSHQINDEKKNLKKVIITFVVGFLIVFGMAMYKVNTAKAAVNTNNSIVSVCKIGGKV